MEIQTHILKDQTGGVALLFDDPNFVRSSTIFFDDTTGYLHALLEDKPISLGTVRGELAALFKALSSVQLSSLRADGSVLDMRANLIILN